MAEIGVREKISRFIEGLGEESFALVIAALGFMIPIFQHFDILPHMISEKNYPNVILFVLSCLCTYLFFLRRSQKRTSGSIDRKLLALENSMLSHDAADLAQLVAKIDDLKKNADSNMTMIFDTLGINYRFVRFDTGAAMYEYVTKRINEAVESIDDMSWRHFSRSMELWATTLEDRREKQARDEYEKATSRASQNLQYREVFVFNDPARIERLKLRIEENSSGYSCRYFPKMQAPRIDFVVIDGKEVIFLYEGRNAAERCVLQHKDVSNMFRIYYEELWQAAIPIKDGALTELGKARAITIYNKLHESHRRAAKAQTESEQSSS